MLSPLRFLLLLSLLSLWPFAKLRAVVIKDPITTTPTENSAVFRWTTDMECGTTLKLGTSAAELTKKVTGGVGTQHEIAVNGLLPGTRYFYSVGTAKKALQTGNFITKGKPAGGTFSPPPTETKTPPPVTTVSAPKTVYKPPPTSKTWGDRSSLTDHFNRHGSDFKAASPDDYAAKAWLFLQRAMDESLPAKLDEDGTIRVWEPKSHTFAAYNRDFSTKTFFRPNSGDYFQRQPGKPVKLKHVPAKS